MITANGAYNISVANFNLALESHIADDEGNVRTISHEEAYKMSDKTDLVVGEILFVFEKRIESIVPSLIEGICCSMRVDKDFFKYINMPYTTKICRQNVLDRVCTILKTLGYKIIPSDDAFIISWARDSEELHDHMLRERAFALCR